MICRFGWWLYLRDIAGGHNSYTSFRKETEGVIRETHVLPVMGISAIASVPARL